MKTEAAQLSMKTEAQLQLRAELDHGVREQAEREVRRQQQDLAEARSIQVFQQAKKVQWSLHGYRYLEVAYPRFFALGEPGVCGNEVTDDSDVTEPQALWFILQLSGVPDKLRIFRTPADVSYMYITSLKQPLSRDCWLVWPHHDSVFFMYNNIIIHVHVHVHVP